MELGDLLAQLKSLVRSIVGPAIDSSRPYRARVAAQRADGTLDLILDKVSGQKLIPDLTEVPIHYGIPGVTAKVKVGAYVMVEFIGGDISHPYASVWESASVAEVQVNGDLIKFGGGARSVICEGDTVMVTIGPITAKAIYAAGLAPGPSPPISVAGVVLKQGLKKVLAP